MSINTIACGEAWQNHPKRNVAPILQTLHALIAAVISRKELLFSKFGGKIKFSYFFSHCKKKAAGEKNMLVGLVNIAI